MKYISIVKSTLNPSTIAPNELDFYKESMLKNEIEHAKE
jgi:hypothetical protein